MSTVLFQGARRGWATQIVCDLCRVYDHDHVSRFAYLTSMNGGGTLQNFEILTLHKFLHIIEEEEAATLNSHSDVVQSRFKCCGRVLHKDEFFREERKWCPCRPTNAKQRV